ncbi:hypothetical protein [Burkholderia ubonensis]|uniref:hypothetical protein n=1 Tax=Burkholderia ubonensis TaxID=101571 RepID=UPI0012F71343|nr:hypothetical protein [Burkholderia ubonensis]
MKRALFFAFSTLLIGLTAKYLYSFFYHKVSTTSAPLIVEMPVNNGRPLKFRIASNLKPTASAGFFVINHPIPGLAFGSSPECRQGQHLMVASLPSGPTRAESLARGTQSLARRLPGENGFQIYTEPLPNSHDVVRYRVFTDDAGDTVSVIDSGAWSADYEFEHTVAGHYLFRFLVKKNCGSNFREFDRHATRFVNSMIIK